MVYLYIRRNEKSRRKYEIQLHIEFAYEIILHI